MLLIAQAGSRSQQHIHPSCAFKFFGKMATCPRPIVGMSVAELSMFLKEKGLTTEICEKFEGREIVEWLV